MVIKANEVIEEHRVCPYCMSRPRYDALGCCGESNQHFETAYETRDGEWYLESEVTIREA